MPFAIKQGGASGQFCINFTDDRFSYGTYGKPLAEVLPCFDRSSLLRTTTDADDTCMHFEYRGMDACMSSIFLGLKMELMKAICKKAIQAALEGIKFNPWCKEYKDAIQKVGRVSSFFEIYDLVCRNSAKVMLKELSMYMPKYALCGLEAWTTFVNILDKETGTEGWYNRSEAAIILKLGSKNIVSSIDIDNGTLVPLGLAYVPSTKKGKMKFYDAVFSEKRKENWRYASVESSDGAFIKESCLACGKSSCSAYTVEEIGVNLCSSCGERELPLRVFSLPNVKKIRKGTDLYKEAYTLASTHI
jgi:hypothetical protein